MIFLSNSLISISILRTILDLSFLLTFSHT
jgi:hypothetical protein